MFLGILEFLVENKKKLFRENCFENVVSDLKEKWPMCPKNYFKKKVQKKTTKKQRKPMKTLKIFGRFWGQNNIFW